MITRIVLGDGTELTNVSEVQEIVQNNGTYIYNGLTINFSKKQDGTLPYSASELQDIFSADNVLDNLKIYKKDIISTVDEEGNSTTEYSDEYLALETSKYTGVQSIYHHVGAGTISIQLNSDPTKLADERYNDLQEENKLLNQAILELSMLLAGGNE